MATTLGKLLSTDSNGNLFDMRVELSPAVSEDWCKIFDELWALEFYNMRRRAHAENDAIVVTCGKSELMRDHYPHLKDVVGRTNERYDQLVAERSAQEQAAKAQAQAKAQKDAEDIEAINKQIDDRNNE